MDNLSLSRKILELVGGKDNILAATNCMTRLRLRIKDSSLVKLDELKSLEGVLGVVEDETLQVVVGPGKAKKLGDIFTGELQVSKDPQISWEDNKAAIKSNIKDTPIKRVLRTISNIFIPLIPAIIAAGLFSGFAQIIAQLGANKIITLGQDSPWELIRLFLSLVSTGFLGYFAIYTGINSAKQFGATEALGGMLGAMSIAAGIVDISKFSGLYNVKVPLESILTTGKGGIIGVVLGVWILAKVEKTIRKRVPDVLDLILTPTLTMLITGILFVFVVMPVSGYASDWLVGALNLIINSEIAAVRIISGFVLAAVFLPMVLFGLHHGLIAIYSVQLATLKGVTLFPVLAMAGAGQVGAAFAIYLKARKVNKKLKDVIVGAIPAGILGVGEPLIYGVTLPLGKPFITAGLGAGFGGAFVMLMNVMGTAWGPSGVVALPLMTAGPNGATGILYYFIGLVISYIMGFVITMFFIKDSDVRNA